MTKSFRYYRAFTLTTLSLAFAHVTSSLAQSIPDAGQIMRELRQTSPGGAKSLSPASPPDKVEESTGNDIRITVTRFDIEGNTSISTDDLQDVLTEQLGRQLSLSDLKAAASRLTALYRERGFLVARAYLPVQDVQGGKIKILILEGNIAQLQLRNTSSLSDERAQAFLNQAVAGSAIRSDQIDRALLLLNDVPGVGAVRATLQPGASVGTSDLVVDVEAGSRVAGSVGLDNYGSRYTGEKRLSGTLYVNNLVGIGDQTVVSGLLSDRKLGYGRVGYSVPVGGSGLRVGTFVSSTKYELAREFAVLDAHGTAKNLSIYATYPVVRTQRANLTSSVSLESRRLSDRIDAIGTVNDKKARVVGLGLSGSYRDDLGGGGLSNFDVATNFGKLSIESPVALAIDEISAKTNGTYRKVSVTGNRLQRLSDNDSLWLALSAQWASKNLDSSEKFVLGGASGVRAYPQGEGIGDQGYLASIEYRHNFSEVLQAALFYDTGSVSINREAFDSAASNKRTLSGMGLGFNAVLGGADLRASLAWRTSGEPLSVPAGASKSPTMWLRANKPF
ncbi:ShlB/FhaC/HecB family hemolysin secretion/activation protein [Noviherbaspirillum sp. 1P10PC]|uniref:ShlB/FhaC/HecB family hemolysin secretion/activation protein n=1 Tax=Noviherbaspirillum sp. 1P10PC TaxID=3132292 RepID=UPI0039A12D66